MGLAYKLWWVNSNTLSEPSNVDVVFKWVWINLAAATMNKIDNMNGNSRIHKFNILLSDLTSSSS